MTSAGATLAALTLGASCTVPDPSGNSNSNSDNANQNADSRLVSFRNDVLPIFQQNCVECHRRGGFADQRGISMRLSVDEAWGSIVNQPSSQDSAITRIVPGQVSESVLYLKISSDSPPIGVRMPFQRMPLSAANIERIRLWIEQGALDN